MLDFMSMLKRLHGLYTPTTPVFRGIWRYSHCRRSKCFEARSAAVRAAEAVADGWPAAATAVGGAPWEVDAHFNAL